MTYRDQRPHQRFIVCRTTSNLERSLGFRYGTAFSINIGINIRINI